MDASLTDEPSISIISLKRFQKFKEGMMREKGTKALHVMGIGVECLSYFGESSFYRLKDYDQLDQVLERNASFVTGHKIDSCRYLRVIPFALVTFRDQVAAAIKGNSVTLGFGRRCLVSNVPRNPSFKNIAIETLYSELDLYLPNTGYSVNIAGLLHTSDRETDRSSVGCVFHAHLTAPFESATVEGKYLALVPVSQLNRDSLEGWSQCIYDCCLRKGLPPQKVPTVVAV